LIAFAIYAAAVNPECYKKLQEEIEQFYPNPDQLSHDDLKKSDYFTAFLNETLRLYSVVPM
jgi:cytochrome P450